MVDASNRAGTVYWDQVRLSGAITLIDKICSSAGDTIQLQFDPVRIFEVGDSLMFVTSNTSATSNEYFVSASGVSI